MVAETIPDCGRLLDPDEQSTVLQHVRYFSKNEQVLYVCHADDETRETEKRQLGRGRDSNAPDKKHASKESHSNQNRETQPASQENTCTGDTIKKNMKLVRFNSQPHIWNEEECRLKFGVEDATGNVRPFPARPSTPKPKKRDRMYTQQENSVLPPLRSLRTMVPANTFTNGKANSSSKTSQNNVLTKDHLMSRTNETSQGKHEKTPSPGASPKLTPRRAKAAMLTNPLACKPPNTETILRKVLTRGAFGGSLTSLASSTESDISNERGRSVKIPEVAGTQLLTSPVSREHSLNELYTSPTTRSHSLPRHISTTSRQHHSEINRALMTSPLSTLRIREAMESPLMCASTTVVHTLTQRGDLAAQFERMSPESHLELIKRALAPHEDVDQFRGGSSTIGGREKADVLLRRRAPGVVERDRMAGSLVKLNVQFALRQSKQRLLRARQDG